MALAHDILAWTQLLALTGHPARKWEPRTIRARLMHIPATIARHARRTLIRYRADHLEDDKVTQSNVYKLHSTKTGTVK